MDTTVFDGTNIPIEFKKEVFGTKDVGKEIPGALTFVIQLLRNAHIVKQILLITQDLHFLFPVYESEQAVDNGKSMKKRRELQGQKKTTSFISERMQHSYPRRQGSERRRGDVLA